MGKLEEGLRHSEQVGPLLQPQKPTILIVDDEPVVRAVCKAVLETNGFQTVLAENGREGLNVYREQQSQIDLVLSDVSMPQMDGIEMVRQIFAEAPHTNVILMTGYHPDYAVPEVLKKLCALIAKPFQTKSLVDTVRKCLKYESEHHPIA